MPALGCFARVAHTGHLSSASLAPCTTGRINEWGQGRPIGPSAARVYLGLSQDHDAQVAAVSRPKKHARARRRCSGRRFNTKNDAPTPMGRVGGASYR